MHRDLVKQIRFQICVIFVTSIVSEREVKSDFAPDMTCYVHLVLNKKLHEVAPASVSLISRSIVIKTIDFYGVPSV